MFRNLVTLTLQMTKALKPVFSVLSFFLLSINDKRLGKHGLPISVTHKMYDANWLLA